MFDRFPSFQLLGILGFLAVILLFPIYYPILTREPDGQTGQFIVLNQAHPLSFTVVPTAAWWSDIVLWTNEELLLPSNTPLTLDITLERQPVRHITTTFSHAFHQTSHELHFAFRPLIHSAGKNYTLSFSIAADHTLPLRRPLLVSDTAPAAFQLLATRPLVVVLGHELMAQSTDGKDIYYYWHRGQQIAEGQDPYLCVLDNSCLDHKNPGHFPLFYWLSAAVQKIGLASYEEWINFWHPVFILAGIAVGIIIFITLYRRGQPFLALFSLLFWLFNRWSLYVVEIGQVDFLPILFLALSVVLFDKRRRLSILCFSVSLALKQLAIFLVPLYLVLLWQRTTKDRLRTMLEGVSLMASVPLLASAPFLIAHPQAMPRALIFSLTRNAADLGAPSFSHVVFLQGVSSIIFMLLLMGLVCLITYLKKAPLSVGALAIYFSFIAFNGVVFNQYFLWFVVFIPFALSDLFQANTLLAQRSQTASPTMLR